jgi:hypothetical protein
MKRTAWGLTFFASLALTWLSLGVGIIGADGDRANLLYGGVLLVGLIGAVVAQLKPGGMALTLVAMAATQAGITAAAIGAGWGLPWSPALELFFLNAVFIVLFLGAAALFRRCSQINAGTYGRGGYGLHLSSRGAHDSRDVRKL